MKPQARIDQLTKDLEAARAEQRACRHDWTIPVYDPVHTEAYTIPGDEPGTMGVDWRGPCHVPAETTPRWTRTCKACGLTDETQQSRAKVTVNEPVFH